MTANDSILSAHPVKPKIRPLIDNGDGTHSVPTNKPGVMALIDSADAEVVGRYCWQATRSQNGRDWYVSSKRQSIDGNRRECWLHHVIAGRPLGNLESDHINRNPLDNRRCNIRHVTHEVNARNRSYSRRNAAGFLGISFHGPTGKYFASISEIGKRTNLGYCDTAEDAARLYDAAREILGHDPLYGNHLPLALRDYHRAYKRLNATRQHCKAD